MSQDAVKKELAALMNNDADKTDMAKLRLIYDQVEATLDAGVRREKVLDLLKKHGIKMNINTFNNAMYRIRKKSKKSLKSELAGTGDLPTRSKANVGSGAQNEMSAPGDQGENSHRPEALDKIFNSSPNLDALARQAKGNKK